jgi:hypothetical protein
VPSEHCFGFDDQKRGSRSSTVDCRVEQREDCSVGVGEPRSSDLTLQDENLVPQGQDLCVARISGGEEPTDSRHNKATNRHEERHSRGTVTIVRPR